MVNSFLSRYGEEGHFVRGNSIRKGVGPEKNLPVNKLSDHSSLPTMISRPLLFRPETGITWEFVKNAEFQAPQTSWMRTSILTRSLTCMPRSERQAVAPGGSERPPAGTEGMRDVEGGVRWSACRTTVWVGMQVVLRFGQKACLWESRQLNHSMEHWSFCLEILASAGPRLSLPLAFTPDRLSYLLAPWPNAPQVT